MTTTAAIDTNAGLPVLRDADPRLQSEKPIGYRCMVPCVMTGCSETALCGATDNPAMARCVTCSTEPIWTNWHG